MKLLLVTAKYPPFSGGAENSIHELLIELSKKNHTILVLTKFKGRGNSWENIPICEVNTFSIIQLENICKKFNPDKILTQLEWSEESIEVANRLSIPIIFFSRIGELNQNADGTIFNSDFHLKKLNSKFNLKRHEFELCYPLIRLEKYRYTNSNRQFVTIVNPVRAKGGNIIKPLAIAFPNQYFIGLKQWCDPERDSVDFENHNIILLGYKNEIKYVYAHTKVLLVPSQFDDPSPRVVVEAMASGIPVIASDVGGISEVMRGGGILLPPQNIESWKQALSKLLNDKLYYRKISESCNRAIGKYSFQNEVDKAENFIKKVKCKNDYSQERGETFFNLSNDWFPKECKE